MRVSSLFYFLAGSSEQVIEDCPPAERNYHTAIGGFVLITAVVASMSGGYALYTVFRSVPLAILFGLFWGIAIGAIDRFIVMTIDLTQHKSLLRTAFSASLRLVLALFVAIVVARPLELRIFEPEIAGYLSNGIRQDLGQRIAALEADLARRQAAHESNARLAAEKDANLTLAADLQTCRAEQDRLREAVHGECDGTLGTMQIGAGPICKLKKQDHDDVKARCDGLDARHVASDQQIETLRAENEKVYADLRAETEATIDGLRRAAGEQIAAIQAGDTGSLLTRLEALSALSHGSDGMAWAIGFITALFVVVEGLPVGLKLMTTGWDPLESTCRHASLSIL